MKKSNNQNPKKVALTLLLAVLFVGANAQKLPNVQPSTGLRAPATIKVDGKANEWDATFQAYNHATDIYYSMANDDDKLYLVVQATDRQIINKIIGGGVTLTIQKSGKKTDKDGISIIYPLFDAKDRPYVRGGGDGGGTMKVFTVSGGGGGAISADAIRSVDVVKSGDSPNAKMEGDSIMNVYNKRLDEKSKNIGVIGIPGVDTLISVYNEDGIKTGERFNNKLVYTYELSIDLKKLGLSVNDAAKFAYHIKLNGATMGVISIKLNGVGGGAPDPAMQEKMQQLMSQMGANNSSVATDFWGEYTLVRKQ